MSQPDFSSKVLSLRTIGEEGTTKLKHGRWEDQCGQTFLIGQSMRGKDDRFWANRTIAVRWDRVTEYIAFDNVAEFEREMGAPMESHTGQKVVSLQSETRALSHEPAPNT